jgi:uncharacterized protein (DUF342 family)
MNIETDNVTVIGAATAGITSAELGSDDAQGLHVGLDETGKTITATFVPETGRMPPDRTALLEALGAKGWREASLDDTAIAKWLSACQRGSEPVEAAVGELLDGYFELEIERDELTVRLTLLAAQGGKPVTPIDVRTALASRAIVTEPDESALRRAFEAGFCDGLPIVTGIAPQPGTPARFVNLLQDRRPGADDKTARIDFRDLGSLLLVKPGTPLMRRVPAVPGTPGKDVYGRVLPAPEVADPPFSERVSGVAPDPQDPNVLVAAVAGMPSVITNGMSVNPVVDVEAVDMHSGNIAFDGTLRVNGDIKTGMTVKVAGDVIVSGTIEAAHVEAGGNVMVNGGIIGKSEAGQHDPASAIARIHCNGAVHARFIENAVVEAGTTVTVDSGIRQSDVAAGESINAGDPATGAGNITGGRCRAWHAVRAASLGAHAGTQTVIHVGLNPYMGAEKAALESTRERMEQDQAKVQQLIAFFAKHPEKATPELREKARATLFKYTRETLDIDAKLGKLTEQLQPYPEAAVVVGKKIHGGVTLWIGQKTMRVMEDMNGGELRLLDDRIGFV